MNANRFEKFIRHYDRHHRAWAKDDEDWFLQQPTLRMLSAKQLLPARVETESSTTSCVSRTPI